MNKIFILVFLCFGAYGCDPADPVPNFMDFNDKDRDGALSLQEWMASKAPSGLRAELNLRSNSDLRGWTLIVTARLALMSWERNRLQRFIGPKICALLGLGQTDPRIKINPPSNKAHEREPGFTSRYA